MRRGALTSLLVVLALGAAPGTALTSPPNSSARVSSGAAPELLPATGDATVRAGRRARFAATALPTEVGVGVHLQPREHEGGNCCGRAVRGDWVTDADGSVSVDFVWPRRYAICSGPRTCRWKPWRRGGRAVVTICVTGPLPADLPAGAGCAKRTVGIR
jgi:hypothetical protein